MLFAGESSSSNELRWVPLTPFFRMSVKEQTDPIGLRGVFSTVVAQLPKDNIKS